MDADGAARRVADETPKQGVCTTSHHPTCMPNIATLTTHGIQLLALQPQPSLLGAAAQVAAAARARLGMEAADNNNNLSSSNNSIKPTHYRQRCTKSSLAATRWALEVQGAATLRPTS